MEGNLKMLSKAEIKELYKEELKRFEIRKELDEKKFSKSYLDKAMHNLELAGVLEILSNNNDAKKAVGISPKSNYSDWIIITSYYSMYLAATAALAKIGVKCKSHDSTITALEYNYCIEKNLLERKYIEMIQQANFGKDDVNKLDEARKGRINVQYTISRKYGDSEAKRILKDAREFVKKINEILS